MPAVNHGSPGDTLSIPVREPSSAAVPLMAPPRVRRGRGRDRPCITVTYTQLRRTSSRFLAREIFLSSVGAIYFAVRAARTAEPPKKGGREIAPPGRNVAARYSSATHSDEFVSFIFLSCFQRPPY